MKESAINAESMDAVRRQVLDDAARVILAVSDHVLPSQKIEMDTMLIADLGLESIEIATLIFRLNAQYSGSVSLGDFVVDVVSADRLSDLPVGSIVDFIADSIQPDQADPGPAPESAATLTANP